MSDYISKVLGGKVKYSGKPIHETHKRIGVNEFDITKLFDYFEEESSTIEISKSLAE